MRKLFDLAQLKERASLRFPLESGPEGFAVLGRDGAVRAWVNLCPHRAQLVDAGDGRLFVSDFLLECEAHGARFDADSGLCLSGPCPGRSLTALPIEERDGAVFLEETVDDP